MTAKDISPKIRSVSLVTHLVVCSELYIGLDLGPRNEGRGGGGGAGRGEEEEEEEEEVVTWLFLSC